MKILKSKWLLLAALYIAQTIPMAFFMFGLPAILRKHGVSLENIGLMRLVALPWMLKFLWAPFIDQNNIFRMGHRKGWILLTLTLSVFLTISISALDPVSSFKWIIFCFVIISFLCATNDIATDGLAVEILPHNERGIGNAIQVAGIYAAKILGAGVLLIAYERIGWRASMLLLALGLSLPILFTIAFQEKSWTKKQTSPFDFVKKFFQQADIFWWLLLIIILRFGVVGMGTMLRPMMIDYKFSLTQVGMILGVAGFTASLFGTFISGWTITKLGRKKTFLYTTTLCAISLALFIIPSLLPSCPSYLFYAFIMIYFIAEAGNATLIFTMIMDRCKKETAGSDFSIQQCLFAATLQLGTFSGFFAQRFTYAVFFAICTIVTLFAFPLALKKIHWDYNANQ